MWACIAIVLLSCTGTFGMSVECLNEIRDKCDYSVVPDTVPETLEELDKICSEMPVLGNCFLREIRTCNENVRKDIATAQADLKFIEDSCSADSPIYQAISENIECIADEYKSVNDVCDKTLASEARLQLISDKKESLKGLESPDYFDIDERANFENICVDAAWKTACTAFTIGNKCGGEETRKAIVKVMFQVYFHLKSCHQGPFPDAYEFIEALTFPQEEEQVMLLK